jgi:hypothetical protein
MTRRPLPVCLAALMLGLASLAGAATPADRYVPNTTGDTVSDSRTGLVWQGTVNASTYTWDAARSYCAGLGGGWRLPSLKELLTLVDPTRPPPTIDPAFPNTPAEGFWSASPYVRSSGYAWLVFFSTGSSADSATSSAYRVRCVR